MLTNSNVFATGPSQDPQPATSLMSDLPHYLSKLNKAIAENVNISTLSYKGLQGQEALDAMTTVEFMSGVTDTGLGEEDAIFIKAHNIRPTNCRAYALNLLIEVVTHCEDRRALCPNAYMGTVSIYEAVSSNYSKVLRAVRAIRSDELD